MSKNNKQLFIDWLKNNRPSSVTHYSGAIDTITKELKNLKLISVDIYSIDNAQKIDEIIETYLGVEELGKKDKTGKRMYSAALKKYKQFLEINFQNHHEYDIYVEDNEIGSEIINIENNMDQISATEKETIINSRIGQSKFKNGLVGKYRKCILCEIDIPELLIASHIKPWSKSDNMEKLDLNNGLLLCCLHDKLFDLGFISFDISGKIIISDQINLNTYDCLKINTEQSIEVDNKSIKYLIWHKENILK